MITDKIVFKWNMRTNITSTRKQLCWKSVTLYVSDPHNPQILVKYYRCPLRETAVTSFGFLGMVMTPEDENAFTYSKTLKTPIPTN